MPSLASTSLKDCDSAMSLCRAGMMYWALAGRARNEVGLLPVVVAHEAEVVPTQPVVHGELGVHAPAVLDVGAEVAALAADLPERRRLDLVRSADEVHSARHGGLARSEQELRPAGTEVLAIRDRREETVVVEPSARPGRPRPGQLDALRHETGLETVGLVDLREVVGELQRVAEALGHQPVHGAKLPKVAHEDQREPAVARDLRDALDAVLAGDVVRVVAE